MSLKTMLRKKSDAEARELLVSIDIGTEYVKALIAAIKEYLQ